MARRWVFYFIFGKRSSRKDGLETHMKRSLLHPLAFVLAAIGTIVLLKLFGIWFALSAPFILVIFLFFFRSEASLYFYQTV